MRKRITSLLLSACLVITMMPAAAFAGQSEAPTERRPVSERAVNHVRDGEKSGAFNKAVPAATEAAAEPLEKQAFAAPGKAKTAKASDVSASVNGIEYDNLYTAVEAAPAGATVKVVQSLHLAETLVIDKKLTLDLGGNYLITSKDDDVITVDNADVTIRNGNIHMYYNSPGYITSCIYVWGDSTALIEDIHLHTVRQGADGIYIGKDSSVVMNNCEHTNSLDGIYTSYVEDITTVQDDNTGVYVCEGASLELNNCFFKEFSSSVGVWSLGTTAINDCYIVQNYSKDTTTNYYGIAILAEVNANVTIDDGYYYAENPVWISNSTATVKVLEGWFTSYWLNDPVFDGEVDSLLIPSGYRANKTDWKALGNVDELWVYRNAAPSTVKVNLTPYYGQNAGYDDLKITWSSVSHVDGYKVYYKKSSASGYSLLKTVAAGKTRSAMKKNLSDGIKYYGKVVPYVKIADKAVSEEAIKTVNCSKYKTAYVYTLKKLAKPTVTKSGTKVKVKWKNINGETGYQISKSKKKSGTNIVTTYATTSGTYKTIKADKGKTYYYKVRAYKTVDGKKIFGPWSDVRAYKR